tara:strand:+ start:1041 stop:1496 length:456 start_codon:yes stop_codon:yes gene_type:complete
MKKVSLDTWIQLLGLMSVLGGLVFVGLQMEQTQQIAIAGQVQARAEMMSTRILNGLEGNLDANRLFNISSTDFQNLESQEKFVARQMHTWMGIMFENNFAQYQMGLLTDDYWKQQEERIRSWWEKCELRPLSQQVQSFQAYLDSLPQTCEE